MKKDTMNVSTIAIAAMALVLSGGLCLAGDFSDIQQNDNGPSGGGHRALVKPHDTLKVELAAGAAFQLDQNDNGPMGGGSRRVTLYKPRPQVDEPEETPKSDRFIGICLNFPIGGQLICWN